MECPIVFHQKVKLQPRGLFLLSPPRSHFCYIHPCSSTFSSDSKFFVANGFKGTVHEIRVSFFSCSSRKSVVAIPNILSIKIFSGFLVAKRNIYPPRVSLIFLSWVLDLPTSFLKLMLSYL